MLVWRAWREERGSVGGCGNDRRRVLRRSGMERREGSERERAERGERRGVMREVRTRV